MKIIESYKQTLNNTRFLSKITSFLIAIFLFSEIFQSFYSYFFLAEKATKDEIWLHFLISTAIQLFLAAIFSIRFILLWSKNPKYIWFSQIVWLTSWLSILAYNLVTRKVLFGSFLGERQFSCMDCMYFDTFIYASTLLTIVLLAYLFLSPLKQILIFIMVLGNRGIPNNVMKSIN